MATYNARAANQVSFERGSPPPPSPPLLQPLYRCHSTNPYHQLHPVLDPHTSPPSIPFTPRLPFHKPVLTSVPPPPKGLTPEEMHAHVGNLCLPPDSPSYPTQTQLFSSSDFFSFDLAAICLGFHHFDDPPLAARRLVERLRPGSGVLMILDFLPHEKMDASHPASGTVIHHGFSKEQIQKIFEDAGAGEHFAFEELAVVFNKAAGTREEIKRKIFMARGTRRAE